MRLRLQLDCGADVSAARAVAEQTLALIDGVDPSSIELVVRALWDRTGGHMHAGVLVELRYRIAEVRHRIRMRSVALEQLLGAFREAVVPLARPHLGVASESFGTETPQEGAVVAAESCEALWGAVEGGGLLGWRTSCPATCCGCVSPW